MQESAKTRQCYGSPESLRGKKADELVPMGAVGLTPAEEEGDVE